MSLQATAFHFRTLLNRNSAIAIVVALVLILYTGHNIVTQIEASRKSSVLVAFPSYYYDLTSNRLFVATSNDLPPIEGPGSRKGEPTAARAFVFACNDCSNPQDRFVAWLEIYTPDAQTAFKKQIESWKEAPGPEGREPLGAIVAGGHLIGKPEANGSVNFVPYESPAGHKILSQSPKRCGAKFPTPCTP